MGSFFCCCFARESNSVKENQSCGSRLLGWIWFLSPASFISALISWRRPSDNLLPDEKYRLMKLSFNDYDETSLLMTEKLDGHAHEVLHPLGEETDYGAESETEPIDEGAVIALSMDEIRMMRSNTFVRPPDSQNLELTESLSRLEQDSFVLVGSD